MRLSNLKQTMLQMGLILIALEIIAIGIQLFFAPHEVAAGGATGVGILLEELMGWRISTVVLVINIGMLILAYFLLDKKTTLRILFGSFMLPVCLAITPQAMVVEDKLLAIIIGSVVYAAGIALLYRIDASSGGSTVPPLIFKKYFNIKPALSLLVVDLLVCFANVFVSGFETFMLATCSSILTLITMNYIETGLNRKKVLYVMSNEQLATIKEHLVEEADVGVTIFDVTGGYSNEDKQTLMLVVENQAYQHIINKIHEVDPLAFTIVGNIAEVRGGSL
ncbi:YitT family protein [Latilactobacillus sakei]|uniref:YitT family protein n=1 Tax=Latilactobacillus sakei TaxID=1599 RepID=UPI00202EFDB9|nr:YitT family protein [Latilactobacillus sakei]MCM1597619.1 YitT family protein [Latilactobacillus sakei]